MEEDNLSPGQIARSIPESCRFHLPPNVSTSCLPVHQNDPADVNPTILDIGRLDEEDNLEGVEANDGV